jgi:hypothetical protein
MQILSNGVGPNSANGLDCVAIWNGGQTFGNDQWAIATFKTVASPTATLTITSVAANTPSSGQATYHYTVATGDAATAISGGFLYVIVSGFVNAGNNGHFVASSFAAGTFTVTSNSAVNESAAAVGYCASDSGAGVGVRMSGTNASNINGYFFHAGTNSFGGGGRKAYYELWKVVNGVGRILAQANDGNTLSVTVPSVGDTIGISVIGSQVTAYINGIILTGGIAFPPTSPTGVFQVTDTDIASGGVPALWTFAISGASEYNFTAWASGSTQFPGNNGTTINSFQAGDIVAVSAQLAAETFTETGTFGNSDLVPYTNGDLHTKNANWVYQSGSFTVSSGKVYGSAVGVSFAYRSDISAPTNDQWAEEVVTMTVVTGTQNSGPAVRVASGAATAYCLQMGTNTLILAKCIAGVFTQLGTASAAVTGDAVRITAVGTAISVFKNGLLVIGPITNSDIASGNVGIFNAGNATSNGFSKWAGGSITELTAATNFVDDTNQFVLLDPTNGCFVGIGDSTGHGQILENTVTWPANQFVQLTLSDVSTLTTLRGPGVRTSVGSNGYFLVNTSTNTAALYRIVSSVGALITSGAHVWVAGDTMRLEVQGDYLVGKVNGTKVLEALDSNITSGKAGALWAAAGVASKGGSGIGAIATITTFTAGQLGGNAISGSAGVAGATVSYSGTASGSVTADGSGNYSIPSLADGPYTITPSLAGYTFSPTSRAVTVAGLDTTGVDFTATLAPTGGSESGFTADFTF